MLIVVGLVFGCEPCEDCREILKSTMITYWDFIAILLHCGVRSLQTRRANESLWSWPAQFGRWTQIRLEQSWKDKAFRSRCDVPTGMHHNSIPGRLLVHRFVWRSKRQNEVTNISVYNKKCRVKLAPKVATGNTKRPTTIKMVTISYFLFLWLSFTGTILVHVKTKPRTVLRVLYFYCTIQSIKIKWLS